MNLTGNRCQCPTCKEYFNSTRAFDKHKTGSYSKNTRRCLSPREMLVKGMSKSEKGFWITEKMAERPRPDDKLADFSEK